MVYSRKRTAVMQFLRRPEENAIFLSGFRLSNRVFQVLERSNDGNEVKVQGEESDVSIEDELEDEVQDSSASRKPKGKRRKRKARGKQFEDDNDPEENVDEDAGTVHTKASETKTIPEEIDKERADSLWADFLKDVDPPAKKVAAISSTSKMSAHQRNSTPLKDKSDTLSPPKKVTITQIYDFAGESVTITKEVDGESKEAKEFLSQTNCSTAENNVKTANENSLKADSSKSPQASTGVKRLSGAGSLVGQILKKKQKLNTLEKSKLDWDHFKKAEGIDEELQRHNKGKHGYLERQAFLERTDLRQFEVEKSLRMKNRSNR